MKLIQSDNPNYRIVEKGTSALSDVETLSIIISGTDSIEKARMILGKCNFNYNMVAKLGYYDMIKSGLSRTQAVRIMATNEYSKRKYIQDCPEKRQIKTSKDIADIMIPRLEHLDHEEFWVLFLNRTNKIIDLVKLSQGGTIGTVTDIKLLFKKAIEQLTQSIILCHNHPSGDINPSEADKDLTQKIKQAGDFFDICLLDHIIVAEKSYFSFADDGLI